MSTSSINPTEVTATTTELSPDPAPSTPHAVPSSETCNLPPVTCNQPRPHCRAIKTNGHRCRGLALDGLHLCHSHFNYRHPALADKDHISIPLLEDHVSIQLVMSQIVHGLLSHRIEPARAKAAIWAAQVAAFTLPRPARLKSPEPEGEQVHRIGFDHEAMISLDPDPDSVTCNLQPVTCNLKKGHRPQATGSLTCNLQPVTCDLNHLCHVPATTEEVWALQDRDDLGLNQPAPEHRYLDPYHPAPPPQPFPNWDAPPRTPPPPPPAHESGLPCDCPKCTRYQTLVQEHLDKMNGRRRKKATQKSEEEAENPLCESNNPTCLGPQSEFCCQSCRKLRTPVSEDPDPDHSFQSTDEGPAPCNSQPVTCNLQPVTCDLSPGVIPETQYPRSSNE